MGANEGSERSLKAPVLRMLKYAHEEPQKLDKKRESRNPILYLKCLLQTPDNGWILRGFGIGTTSRYSLSNLWLSLKVLFTSPQANSLNKGRSRLIRVLRRASIEKSKVSWENQD